MNETELLQARYRNTRDDECFPRRSGGQYNPSQKPIGRGSIIPFDVREAIKKLTEEASTFPPDEVWHSK